MRRSILTALTETKTAHAVLKLALLTTARVALTGTSKVEEMCIYGFGDVGFEAGERINVVIQGPNMEVLYRFTGTHQPNQEGPAEEAEASSPEDFAFALALSPNHAVGGYMVAVEGTEN